MKSSSYSLLVAILLVGVLSCSDDTEVGYGLLGEEDLELVFVDDLSLDIKQISPQPIEAKSGVFHSLGTIDNPTFGKTTASFYVRPVLGSIPDFEGQLDSVVLSLQIDSAKYYGSRFASHDIKVYSLAESIDNLDNISSDQTFQLEPDVLGSREQFVPNAVDSVLFINEFLDSTYFRNILTVRLDQEFGEEIFQDTANNKTSIGIRSLINGLYVTSQSDNSLMQMDLSTIGSSLIFYYQNDSSQSLTHRYPFSSLTNPLNFAYDLEGSVLENAISDPSQNDLLFLQGHAGSMIEIDISTVDALNDPFLNYASLEIYAQAESLLDTMTFPLPPVLDVLKIDENGQFIQIIDVLFQISDGIKRVDQDVVRYEIKITNFIKEYFKGREPPKYT